MNKKGFLLRKFSGASSRIFFCNGIENTNNLNNISNTFLLHSMKIINKENLVKTKFSKVPLHIKYFENLPVMVHPGSFIRGMKKLNFSPDETREYARRVKTNSLEKKYIEKKLFNFFGLGKIPRSGILSFSSSPRTSETRVEDAHTNMTKNSDFTPAFFIKKSEKKQTLKKVVRSPDGLCTSAIKKTDDLRTTAFKEAFNMFSSQENKLGDTGKRDLSTISNLLLRESETQASDARRGLATLNPPLPNDKNLINLLNHTKTIKKKTEYKLETFHRSNQDTCLTHKPAVVEGDWVQSGDFLTDCANSVGGELSLGQNIFIAYMPWEGYNFEDAILISERLVSDDLFTSVHIERYEIENIQKNGLSQQEKLTNKDIRESVNTKKKQNSSVTRGKKSQISTPQIRTTRYEEITRDIPDVTPEEICHLDSFGIVKIGSIVEEGDILVGKITPVNKKEFTPYQKLLYTILDKQIRSYRDSSLRAPKGIKAKVVDIKIFVKPVRSPVGLRTGIVENSRIERIKSPIIRDNLIGRSVARPFRASKPLVENTHTKSHSARASLRSLAEMRLSSYKKISDFSYMKKLNYAPHETSESAHEGNLGVQRKFYQVLPINTAYGHYLRSAKFNKSSRVIRVLEKIVKFEVLKIPKKSLKFSKKKTFKIIKKLNKKTEKLRKENLGYKFSKGFPLNSYSSKSIKNIETIHIYLAEKRKIQVGDKMSGRHGNKGIVSQILPIQDMPFLPDGTPIDMVLNPLGVPSRMNVGQIYECLLGLAGKYLGEHYKISSFDEIYGPEASRSFVFNKLYEARCKTGFKWLFNPEYPGKIRLYDGRTGECYHQPVTVGKSYMLRLVHMVDDKIHMRSTGPYSLVTQQPLRGRSKQGGQRLGEMEVWALEGFGAAFTLLEMLTVKSDDLTGRMTLWSNLILNKDLTIGTPEAFKVLICELQALCLDIGLFRYNTTNFTTFSLGKDKTNLPGDSSDLDSRPREATHAQSEKYNFIKGPQKSLTEMTSLMNFP
jgi:DNA-directed RNA polymerase subunit beta